MSDDDDLTAQDLALRGQQYRKYHPEEFLEALDTERGRRDDPNDARNAVIEALRTVESGRFEPLLETVSDFFFKLDTDERELFTERNPGVVRWMSVWNVLNGLNPYDRWDNLAAGLLRPTTIKLREQSATEGLVSNPDLAPRFERRELAHDTLLEDMMFRRRSYRNWTPGEFFDIAESGRTIRGLQRLEVTQGMARELRLFTAEAREEIDFPTTLESKKVAAALMDRVEAGRFGKMLNAGWTFFVPLDPDERKLFALRNPGFMTWLHVWAFLEDLAGRDGSSLFTLTDVDLPLVEEGNPSDTDGRGNGTDADDTFEAAIEPFDVELDDLPPAARGVFEMARDARRDTNTIWVEFVFEQGRRVGRGDISELSEFVEESAGVWAESMATRPDVARVFCVDGEERPRGDEAFDVAPEQRVHCFVGFDTNDMDTQQVEGLRKSLRRKWEGMEPTQDEPPMVAIGRGINDVNVVDEAVIAAVAPELAGPPREDVEFIE